MAEGWKDGFCFDTFCFFISILDSVVIAVGLFFHDYLPTCDLCGHGRRSEDHSIVFCKSLCLIRFRQKLQILSTVLENGLLCLCASAERSLPTSGKSLLFFVVSPETIAFQTNQITRICSQTTPSLPSHRPTLVPPLRLLPAQATPFPRREPREVLIQEDPEAAWTEPEGTYRDSFHSWTNHPEHLAISPNRHVHEPPGAGNKPGTSGGFGGVLGGEERSLRGGEGGSGQLGSDHCGWGGSLSPILRFDG